MDTDIQEINQDQTEPFLALLGEVECGTEFDLHDPEQEAWIREAISRRYGAGARFYAMYLSNKPIGIAGLVTDKLLHTEYSRAELLDIGISPQYRRGGYGTKLLRFIEDQARLADCWALHLKTYSGDQRAVSFYMKNGYAVVGNVEGTNGPDDYGDVWLCKRLVKG